MSQNFNYETRFTAHNTMSPAINQATQSIQRLTISINESSDAASKASRSFQGLSTSISSGGFGAGWKNTQVQVANTSQAMRGLQQSIFGVQMGLFVFSMLESNMMAVETATNGVETATQRLTTMQREGKMGTDEYRNAVRSLETAQINLNRAQAMTTIMSVSMGLQVVQMGISFRQSIPAIKSMISTLQSYNAVAAVSKALSGPAGWVTLAAGVGIAAGAGIAINSAYSQPASTSNVTVKVTNDDIIQEYLMRTGGNHTKQLGVS